MMKYLVVVFVAAALLSNASVNGEKKCYFHNFANIPTFVIQEKETHLPWAMIKILKKAET